jgi:methyl-accepting chemotaxis protein
MQKLVNFRFKSIQSKLIASFLLIALVPLAIICWTAYTSTNKQQVAAAGSLMQTNAKQTLDKIYRNLFERYGDVQAFAFSPYARGEESEVEKALDFYTATYGCYDLMIVADKEGKIVAANTQTYDGRKIGTSALIGKDVSQEAWFKSCTDGGIKPGQTYYSDAERDPLVGQCCGETGLSLNFSAPVYDEQGEVVRVWSNRASFDRIVGQIMQEQRDVYEESGWVVESQVINKTGLLINDYDPKSILTLNLVDDGLIAAQEVVKGKSGVSIQKQHARRGVELVNGYASSEGSLGFPGYDWGVLMHQETAQIVARSNWMRTFFLIAGALTTTVVLAVGTYLARSIVRPLQRSVEALQSVATGDLGQTLSVSSKDEVGSLAEALNKTVEGMQTALGAQKVDWNSVGQQRLLNADYASQIAAINRSQAVIEFDLQGNILHGNENFLSTVGYTLSEIKGRHHRMFVEESYANSQEYRDFWPNAAAGKVFAGEFARIGKGGKQIWIQASYNPILDVDGKVVRIVKFAQDITARKLEQQATERLEAENAERERIVAQELRSKVDSILEVVNAATEGDLTQDISVEGTDAVGQMGEGLQQFFFDLRNSIASIAENAAALAGASEELSVVSTQMSSNAEETSSQANVVSAASEQVSMNVQTVSTGVEELNAAIREIAKNASDAARVSQQAVSVAENTNITISKLGDSSLEIGKVVKVITSIAEQTNLLALNATIEAARAGEAGKGFAVVANEVKELAKETAKATEDISQKIDAIQTDTQGAVEAIREISEVINQINDISNTIASAVEEQTATANEMGRNVGEAARGASEIAQNITSVASAAESTTHGASNSQQAASELSRMAADLQNLVSRFQYQKNELAKKPGRHAPVTSTKASSTYQSV